MKILITGASGFIGGFLVQEALNRGYEVWAGVRKNSDRSNLQDKRIHFIDLRYDDITTLSTQLAELKETHGVLDYVIHNAGLTKTLNKDNFFRVNALYTKNLIEGLHASGHSLKKFLLMSSLSSYGKGDEKTFRPIRLDDPQNPDTAYGKSKLDAENFIRSQSYFTYVILRPTGVYGPGEKDYFVEIKSVQSGIDFAAGSIPQRITFIYVKDLARAAFLALENEKVVNKHYFVADGDVHTDESFAKMIQDILKKKHVLRGRIPLPLVRLACICSEGIGKLLGKSMTLNTDKYIILKQRNWICDVTPLQDDLGFMAQYPLRKGLEEAIEWYKKEGWL
ncbi:NAD(P)-dependent oxidoreductase [Massilibacteroides sp.]|uniref:NAD-dependent epimerase/dehydratase family protein n=1 Tax=Massilibacteroides sp. TaxID=2034766 RepID=UPI0026152411|nr:NAD(P)-dependent oxidoreductase [Massilibacteroides sp.]MDD4514782.1 NAD(P)-dependent oxidoreductase [Massilibacteroides sp.]